MFRSFSEIIVASSAFSNLCIFHFTRVNTYGQWASMLLENVVLRISIWKMEEVSTQSGEIFCQDCLDESEVGYDGYEDWLEMDK